VNAFIRVMMHCTFAAVAVAHGQVAQDTKAGSALPESTNLFHPVDDGNPLHARLDALASQGLDKVITDRRYIHQHPELSNREFQTSAYIAARVRALGLDVRTPIGKTGVVAVLRGSQPGPTVALRAELDALPYHLLTQLETGQIGYRSGAQQAGSDEIDITVHGRQSITDAPWDGVDAIVVGSQIVLGLQTIVSRQMDYTKSPIILSIQDIRGGHFGAIADSLTMSAALDWYDRDLRQDAIDRIKRTAENIALASGATAEARVVPEMYNPSIYNDPRLAVRMRPTLMRVAGADHLIEIWRLPYADDFALYQEKIPGLFVIIGARAHGDEYFPNHSPKFHIDESSILVGERALAHLTLDYMLGARAPR